MPVEANGTTYDSYVAVFKKDGIVPGDGQGWQGSAARQVSDRAGAPEEEAGSLQGRIRRQKSPIVREVTTAPRKSSSTWIKPSILNDNCGVRDFLSATGAEGSYYEECYPAGSSSIFQEPTTMFSTVSPCVSWNLLRRTARRPSARSRQARATVKKVTDDARLSARHAVPHLAARSDHDHDRAVGRRRRRDRGHDRLLRRRRAATAGKSQPTAAQALSADRLQGLPRRADRPDAGDRLPVPHRQAVADLPLPHHAGQGDRHDPLHLRRRLRRQPPRHRQQHPGGPAGPDVRRHRRRPRLRQRHVGRRSAWPSCATTAST